MDQIFYDTMSYISGEIRSKDDRIRSKVNSDPNNLMSPLIYLVLRGRQVAINIPSTDPPTVGLVTFYTEEDEGWLWMSQCDQHFYSMAEPFDTIIRKALEWLYEEEYYGYERTS